MGPVLVVMRNVDAQHAFEMTAATRSRLTAANDEDPVEAVGADSSHPAFRVRVRVRRPNRRSVEWADPDLDIGPTKGRTTYRDANGTQVNPEWGAPLRQERTPTAVRLRGYLDDPSSSGRASA